MGRDDIEIAGAARNLRRFLEENRQSDRLPFVGSRLFPDNCCERTSCLLAYALEARFGLVDVVLVMGRDPTNDERHYWVESGGRIYDLTADQFEGGRPVYGETSSPPSDRFSEQDRTVERGHFDPHYVRALLQDGLLDP